MASRRILYRVGALWQDAKRGPAPAGPRPSPGAIFAAVRSGSVEERAARRAVGVDDAVVDRALGEGGPRSTVVDSVALRRVGARLVDAVDRLLLSLDDAGLGRRVRRRRDAAARRDLVVEIVRDALVVALALRPAELGERLGDRVLALRLGLGEPVGAARVVAVEQEREDIELVLGARDPAVGLGRAVAARVAGRASRAGLDDGRDGLGLGALHWVGDADQGRAAVRRRAVARRVGRRHLASPGLALRDALLLAARELREALAGAALALELFLARRSEHGGGRRRQERSGDRGHEDSSHPTIIHSCPLSVGVGAV